MTLKKAFEKVIEEGNTPSILKEWNVAENRKIIAEIVALFLEEKTGILTLKDLGIMCVICLQAGRYMAEAE